MLKKHNKHKKTMPPWPSLNYYLNYAYLAVAFLVTSIYGQVIPCRDDSWWDPVSDSCIQCTVCDANNLILLRPCQPHQDTKCGTIDDLEFDLSWMAQTERRQDPNWKERRKELRNLSNNTDDIMWDWQTASLALAAIACLLFFIAAAYISLQHAKQWRQMEKMERRFDRDVEELSARLMHTIVDIRSVENGRIILEEPSSKDRVINPLEVRCVYLEQLLAGKGSIAYPGRGNVYIEENNSSKG